MRFSLSCVIPVLLTALTAKAGDASAVISIRYADPVAGFGGTISDAESGTVLTFDSVVNQDSELESRITGSQNRLLVQYQGKQRSYAPFEMRNGDMFVWKPSLLVLGTELSGVDVTTL